MTRTHKARRGAGLLACLILLLLLPVQAAAAGSGTVDPVGHSENCSAVLYGNTNGLPTSEANDIAQTSEGFIWIGCYSGLIRYDGNTFERMDSTRGVGSVVRLFVDSRDRLWIGTNESGLALLEDGVFRMWNEDDGLGSAKISAIEEDTDGTIYVGTTAGIAMIGQDMELRPVDDPRIAGAYIERMCMGSDGLLYCLTNGDDYFTLRSGVLEDYISHTETSIPEITCILPDPDEPGKIFIGTSGTGFYHGDLTGDPDEIDRVDIDPLFTVIDIRQIGGRIWICANNGIGVLDGGSFCYLDELPMDNSVNRVMEDYEGNLWFTSSRQGVMKVVSNQFSDIFARYGLPEKVVNSTCMTDEGLFVATDTGLIVIGEDGPLSDLPLTSAKTASGEDLGAEDLLALLEGCRIRSIIRDSRGRLWFSTWRGPGLLRLDGQEITAFTEAEGLLSDHIRVVSETRGGAMLVVCTGGLCVIEGDRVTAAFGTEDGIANPESLTVCEAPNGDYVLGSNGGGIYIIGGEGVRCIGTKDGLSSGIVMRLKYDPDRHVFWIVTSNSIAWMTEDYRVTTVQEFPYSNNFDLYENSQGDMWILSSNGIYVLPAESLLAGGEVRPVHYGLANGLPCIATSNSYSDLTEAGDLYIAGSSGVAKVNIESSLEEITDLRQAVPYIEADGELIFPDETGGFTLPAGVQKLTVYSFVFNYSLTDPQVSYCLEGFDREPVTISRSELGPLTYTNLPGGSYRFVMELKDALGRGSKTLTVSIVKEKALYERVWFYCIISLAAAALLSVLVGSYVRRKMRRMEQKHREAAERERIGNELHMASQIQLSMLPHKFPPFPDRPEFGIFASMTPAREVGGDFYDFFLVDDDHLCMIMADVSGKGVPAALFMMASKIILANNAMVGKSPAEVLTDTNAAICSNNPKEMFVTVWLGILEISTGKLTAASAGHEYPALKRPDGGFGLVKDKHGIVVGGMDGVKYKEYELLLEPGSKLFLYTDGVPEATDANEEMFGTDRMLAALNEAPDAPPETILSRVRGAVDAFVKDAEQFDDLTMLCVEYKGNIM